MLELTPPSVLIPPVVGSENTELLLDVADDGGLLANEVLDVLEVDALDRALALDRILALEVLERERGGRGGGVRRLMGARVVTGGGAGAAMTVLFIVTDS